MMSARGKTASSTQQRVSRERAETRRADTYGADEHQGAHPRCHGGDVPALRLYGHGAEAGRRQRECAVWVAVSFLPGRKAAARRGGDPARRTDVLRAGDGRV